MYSNWVNSTSNSEYTNNILLKNIGWIMYKMDIRPDNFSVIEDALDIMLRYIETLANTASQHSQVAGRTETNIVDIQKALECFDWKRYDAIFNKDVNDIKKVGEFPGKFPPYIKSFHPTLQSDTEPAWEYVINNKNETESQLNHLVDVELYEFTDSIPKHIPSFLPIYPPKLTYSSNSTNNHY
ncbi:hypothetical protein ACR3K2_12460 [Cryptosporidium serpentis]